MFKKFIIPLFLITPIFITSTVHSQDYIYRFKEEGELIKEKKKKKKRNKPPEIVGEALTNGISGADYSYQLVATDPNGDTLTWAWSGVTPTGLNLDTDTGEITGTFPLRNLDENYSFDVTVSDGKKEATASFSLLLQGCEESGPVGTACTDNSLYAGEISSQRFYALHISNRLDWADSYNYCDGLRVGSYRDYSLTTRQELTSIINNIPSMLDTSEESPNSTYWTSSTPSNTQWRYYYRAYNNTWNTVLSSTSSRFKFICVRY